MRFWFPLIETGGGADLLTQSLREGLMSLGHTGVSYTAAHGNQYFPWLQKRIPAPAGTDVTVTHSWFGPGFDRPDIPLVVIEHLFTPDRGGRPFRNAAQTLFHEVLVRRFVSESYRRAAATVAVSEATRRQITAHFPDVEPQLIRNGVDLDFFRPPAHRRPPPRDRPVRLLFVGNLIRRKGVDLLPPILRALGPGFELHYTSGLRTRHELSDIANARALGRLDPNQMREAYQHADLLLFPSRMEGLPLAVIEAAACGLPSVVSDASSLPESVLDGESGLVCPTGDIAAFAAAVREIAGDSATLARMGEAARHHAERTFDLRRMVLQYLELFERIRGR